MEGTKGTWQVDPSALNQPFNGRTALLSPFDRLVYNRRRSLELWGFEYTLEMCKPVDKRTTTPMWPITSRPRTSGWDVGGPKIPWRCGHPPP